MCEFSESVESDRTIPHYPVVNIGGDPMVKCPVKKEYIKILYCRNVCLYFFRMVEDFVLCGVKDGD